MKNIKLKWSNRDSFVLFLFMLLGAASFGMPRHWIPGVYLQNKQQAADVRSKLEPGRDVTKALKLPDFKHIHIEKYRVDIRARSKTLADTADLIIKCSENYLPFIRTEVKYDTLFIRVENRDLAYSGGLKPILTLHLDALPESVTAQIGANITMRYLDGLTYDSLSLYTDGLSPIELSTGVEKTLPYLKFEITQPTPGDVSVSSLSGLVHFFELKTPNTGFWQRKMEKEGVELYNLETNYAKIDWPFNVNGLIKVNKRLDVNISGSGNLLVWGSPEINERVSGSGRVRKCRKEAL